ncbi:MAG: hypothetical protein IT295_10260 [Dehalococcoidia bacterium]|nr:hypothetical protein [Dehalococcoidia bacterium]
MPVSVDSVVDAVVARIAACPSAERRALFFEELAKLDPTSRERWELAEFGPRRFPECVGPYVPAEWSVLAAVVYPRREYSPAEIERYADHAEACSILAARRAEWLAARSAAAAAEREAKRFNTYRDKDRPRYEAAATAARELRATEQSARELLDDAEDAEVRLRPFQPEKRLASGRNWLRWMRRRDGAR